MTNVPPTKNTESPKLNINVNRDGTTALLEQLKNPKEAQKIEGQVLRQNSDGSTRIRTPQGTIDVQINGEKLDRGTRVQIEIRPTQQGRTEIRIDVLPNQHQNKAQTPQAQPQAQQNTAPASTTQPPPPKPVLTPYSTGQIAAKGSDLASPPQPQNLQAGQSVRIEAGLPPLPTSTSNAQQAAGAINQPSQAIQPRALSAVLSPVNGLSSQPIATILSPSQSTQTLIQSLLGLSTVTSTPSSILGNNTGFQTVTPISQAVLNAPQASQNLVTNKSTALIASSNNTLTQTPQTTGTNSRALSTPLSSVQSSSSLHSFMNLSAQNNASLNISNIPNLVISNATFSMTVKVLSLTTPTPLSTSSDNSTPNALINNTRPGQITGIIKPDIITANDQTRTPITLYSGERPIGGQFFLPSAIKAPAIGTQMQLSITNISTLMPNGQSVSIPTNGLQGLQQALMGSEVFTNDVLEFIENVKQESTEQSLINSPALKFLAQAASPARLTSTLLFFMAALKGGDLKQWMGSNNIELLNIKQKTELLARLERGFGAISRSAADPAPVPSGEWRSFQLPMLFGMDLSRLQFHIRDYDHNEHTQDDDDDRPLKRVIIDFTMSRMGELQIDSLLMKQRLETVLRSDASFSADMRQDLRKRYTEIMSRIGYQGHLDFQDRLNSNQH